jgi:DNA-binding SARP family transcriptional activator
VEDAGQLRISLLGPCAATSGDTPLDLGGPRQRAVLAVLVLARGEVVPVDRLTESVWGDRVPADPSGALHGHRRVVRTPAPP